MILPTESLQDDLLATLRTSDGSVTLAEFLRTRSAPTDAQLAELIEVDGRFRISKGESVELADYLDAIPRVRECPVALDAAIDMTLRSLAGGTTPTPDAVETLVANYPDLQEAIRDAAVLGQAVWTTEQIAPPRPRTGELPADFGMIIGGGRRQYKLLERLGDGASGDVFLAEDRLLSDADRPALVAVKILRLDGVDPWARRQAADEATKARRIDHPNVVRVLNRGVSEDGEEFLVYEYVQGGDLASPRFTGKLPLTPRDAAALVSAMARGVQAAHSAGLVHCDLKPGNVLLDAQGAPKVADFGAAVRPPDAAGGASSPSRPVGTLAFMSPEQFRMEPGSLTPPTDVYALGGMLYWLLTGRLANGNTRDEVVAAHLADPPRPAPSACAVRPGIDADLDAICRRALSPAARDRHSSPGALADDLDAWRRREPIAWTRPSVARVFSLMLRRRPAVAGAVGAAIVLGLVGGAATLHFRSEAARRQQAAELATLRAQARESERLGDAKFAQSMSPSADDRGWRGSTARDLMMFWWVEGVVGRKRLDAQSLPDELTTRRMEYIDARIGRITESDGADSLYALLLRTQRAFWLTQQENHALALEALEPLEADYRARLNADDPIFDVLDALRWCAKADALVAAGSEGQGRAEAAEIVARLHEAADAVRGASDGVAVRLLIDARLATLYGPAWLADATEAEAAGLRFEESLRMTGEKSR